MEGSGSTRGKLICASDLSFSSATIRPRQYFGVTIGVDNLPEDNLAGRDRQLEAAVEELLKQLGTNRRNIASKEEK